MASAIAFTAFSGMLACGGGQDGTSTTGPGAYHAAHAPDPGSGAPPWPAPRDPLPRTREAGLVPERREQLAYHVHAHLDVFVNGKRTKIPAGIGINIADPGVRSFPEESGDRAYGGIKLCARPCISPLHTHDTTGVLHTESATVTPNRLGQFFTEWGVRLSRSCVGGFCAPRAPIAFFIGGRRFKGDPRTIGLADGREIAIIIGSPPAHIPAEGDFSAA